MDNTEIIQRIGVTTAYGLVVGSLGVTAAYGLVSGSFGSGVKAMLAVFDKTQNDLSRRNSPHALPRGREPTLPKGIDLSLS